MPVTPSPEGSTTPSQRTVSGGANLGYGQLSSRIRGWTSNLLVSAIVLVSGVVFGRQVLVWWHPPEEADAAVDAQAEVSRLTADPLQAMSLEFANQPLAIRTVRVSGEREEIATAMCRECLDSARALGTPRELHPQPGPAEARLLTSLSRQKPLETSGTLEAYVCEGGFPLAVATDLIASAGASNSASRRIVSCAAAMPAGPKAWTVLVFRASSPVSTGSTTAVPASGEVDVPLPPQSFRLLGLRQDNGTQWTTFAGQGEPNAWKGHFERWFRLGHWTAEETWHATGSMWEARYVQWEGETLVKADVQFGPDGRGQLAGLISITRAPPAASR